MSIPDLIINSILDSNKILIVSHINPDPDNLSAIAALKLALLSLNKTVTAANTEPVPDCYRQFPGYETISDKIDPRENFELAIAVDSPVANRVGKIDLKSLAKTIITIDHHISHQPWGDINWVDSQASSTCEMLFLLFKQMKINIDSTIANLLFAGIYTDTVRLSTSAVNYRVLATAAELVRLGAEPELTGLELYLVRSEQENRLLGHLLSNYQLYNQGEVAFIGIDYSTLSNLCPDYPDIWWTANELLAQKEVQLAILIYEPQPGQIEISLRGKHDVNCNLLAAEFGGGGHKLAAGAHINDEFNQAVSKVLKSALKSKKMVPDL